MTALRLSAGAMLIAAAAGCSAPRDAPTPTGPKIEIMPAAGPSPDTEGRAVRPASYEFGYGTSPVYRNPRIGTIYLRAYQDAQGRLMGPQVMYQIVDPGGWNVDAAERGPEAPPPDNLEPSAPESPLLEASRAAAIAITGLMREEDRGEAEAMAAKLNGFDAVFDPQAGWLLVPEGSRRAAAAP